MAYNGVDISQEPAYLSDGSYTADHDRRWFNDIMRDGILGIADFAITAGTGFTLSSSAGNALVLGQNVTDQGLYRVHEPNAHANALTITTADASKPRIDQVILIVMDASNDASGLRKGRIEIIPGVATTGATLNNRNGVADLTALTDNSKSVLLLADLLVPAAVTTSAGCIIRDRRKLTWPKNTAFHVKSVPNGAYNNPGGGTAETDLIPTQTISGYMLRGSDFGTEPRFIEITILALISNNSGGNRTSIYRIYESRGTDTLQQLFTDTSIAIPTSTNSRPLRINLLFCIGPLTPYGGQLSNPGVFGTFDIGGANATSGEGDLGANGLISTIFDDSGGSSISVTSPNLDFNWKITTEHDSNSGSYNESVYVINTKIW